MNVLLPPREIVICKELYNRQHPTLYTVILFLILNNLLKLHKNARLSLFVEIGGRFIPPIYHNYSQYWCTKSKQALKKIIKRTKNPLFFSLHPFLPNFVHFYYYTHTHQKNPIKRCFDQSDMIFTSFWVVIFDSWNRESIRGQCAILYQRRALLCKYFSPQILHKIKPTHSWVVDAP